MNNQITPEQLKEMGNVFYIVAGHGEIKCFAARAYPGTRGDVVFLDVPYIAPISELDGTREAIAKTGYSETTHDLGMGYTLHLFRAADVRQSVFWINFLFIDYLGQLFAMVENNGEVQ